MTVLEVIQRSTEFLTKKEVDSPRLQVELMLAHVLKMKRMALYLNFEKPLGSKELDEVREMVRRRGGREPLQHILGSTCFCGLEFEVNPKVLIPRPETELLAELGWQFLNSLPSSPTPPVALDYGTGSGCLAVTVAAKSPTAQLHALDISPDALATAQKNAATHQMGSRIQFHLGDGFAAVPPGLQFNLIISNPPYIASDEIATLQPEVRDHDPRLALDGGRDGLDFYRRLAKEAAPRLLPNGKIMLEFGEGQAEAIQKLFEDEKWVVEGVKADYSGRLRILIARQTG
ncbi:peptide chain release factor N(5)-glutamine methyltransferase [Pedosphaera parvula]|nr:peptide chain release factor N(5)-glutamine methyltransferase [Pedosphaera parvula]